MPINREGTSIELEFGFGDIDVGPGTLKGFPNTGTVVFTPRSPSPTGTKTIYEPNKEVPIEESPVRMIFHEPEGIDVVVRALLHARRMMLGKRELVPEE